MPALDSIEWATSDTASKTEPSAPQKADGWTASAEAESTKINWLWGEQAVHLIWLEYHAALFDSVIVDP